MWRFVGRGGLAPLAVIALGGCGVLTPPASQPSNDGNGGTTTPSVTWAAASTQVVSASNVQLAANNTPIAARDGQGNLHVVFTDGQTVSHALLAPNSTSWLVRPLNKLNGSSQVTKPTFGIVTDQLMFTAWMEIAGSQASVVISRSLNAGQLWETPLLISQGNYEDVVSLCTFTRASGSGGAVLAWFDVARQKVIASTWRGTLWAASDWTFPVVLASSIFGVSHNVSVAAFGDTVVAAWEDNRFNASNDIFTAKSTNGGLNWNVDVRLPVASPALPQGQSPSVALRTDTRIYLAFQNLGNVFLVTSVDGGTTYGTPRLLGPGRFGHVAVNTKTAWAVAWEHFTGSVTDNTIKSVGLTVSLDDGITLAGPHALPGSASVFKATTPSVTLSDTDIDAFWIDVSDTKANVLRQRNGKLP